VRRRLDVKGDAVGAGAGELLDLGLRPVDHQVHVDRPARSMDPIGDRARDERPHRDRGDEMTVHHVHVDDPRARRHHLVHLGSEP
jgi:hypothetical protein